MAFGRDIQHVVPFQISDPTEDESFVIFKVPAEITKIEILEGYVATNTALSAGTTNGIEVSLLDGGADGTGTAVIAAAIGGTDAGGTFPAWAVATPQAFTISEGTMDAGDYLVVKYDESGTVAPLTVYGQIVYVSGVGA